MANFDRMIYQYLREGKIELLKLIGRTRTIGAESVKILMYDSAGKILMATGLTKPTDATSGYAKGAIFIKTDAGAGVRGFYTNKGTNTSCTFEVGAAAVPGDLTLTTNSVIVGVGGVGADTAMAVQQVLIRAAGAVTPTTIAENRVLGRLTGGNLGAVQITTAEISATAAIALTQLASQAANTVTANATGAGATPTAVAVSAQSLLLRAAGNLTDTTIAEARVLGRATGGNLGAIQITNEHVAAGADIDFSKLEVIAANTVVANNTAGAAAATAVAMGTHEVLIRAGGNIASTAIAENRVLGRLTGGALGAIQVTTAEIAAAANIALTQMADQAALTFLVNTTNGAGKPTALALAANQILAVTAGPVISALAIARKAVLGASASVLTTYALTAGQLLSADANDLVAITCAAGTVVTGGTGPAITAVALPTGSILRGATGATPTALDLSAVGSLATGDGTTVGGIVLARKEILYNAAGVTLDGLTIARGDLVSADANDVCKVSIAAGEVVVGATGPDIDGVALATGSILIGATGATPVALDIAVNEVLYRIGAGTLDGLSLPRKNLLTGGAANLQAIAVAAGDIVTADANDIAVASIAAGEVVVGATGPVVDGVALATNTLLTGATGATPVALLCNEARLIGRATGGVLDDIQAGTEHIAANAITPALMGLRTKSTRATDGDLVATAAELVAGYYERTGAVGAHNLTFDSTANLLAVMGAATYSWFSCLFVNGTDATETIVAGDAQTTLKGTATVPTLTTALLTFIRTAAGTIDVIITQST